MVHYAVNHYVTSGDRAVDSTVHGDDKIAVWVDSDPATDQPDHTHEQPAEGWTWRTNQSGWQKHPNILEKYASDASTIERLSPWETTLTDGVPQ